MITIVKSYLSDVTTQNRYAMRNDAIIKLLDLNFSNFLVNFIQIECVAKWYTNSNRNSFLAFLIWFYVILQVFLLYIFKRTKIKKNNQHINQ